jgi:hypothetical protein
MAKEAKRILLRIGRQRFGPPRRAIEAKTKAPADVEKIEEMTDRILIVSSWDELVDG